MKRWHFDEASRVGVGRQKRFHLASQFSVNGAKLRDERGPLLTRPLERFLKRGLPRSQRSADVGSTAESLERMRWIAGSRSATRS